MQKRSILFGATYVATINRNLTLALGLLKKYALAQGGVKLHKLNLTFCRLSILTSPNHVIGLRRFKPKEAVL